MRLDGFGLFVEDMPAMIRFYRDVLGFEIQENEDTSNVYLVKDGTLFLLYGRKDFEKMTSRKYAYVKGLNGHSEIALYVDTFEEVDREYAKAVSKGAVSVLAPETEPWGQRTCYIADPEGNLIEIGSFNRPFARESEKCMDFYEVVEKRRTVRDFEKGTIPTDVLEKIIATALKAPTNDHMRDWHYIIIQDKSVIAKLLDIIPKGISDEDMDILIKDWNLSDSLQQECYRNAVPKQYRMLFNASAIIIPLLKQKVDILHPDNISHLNGFASIWCSIENIFLAATAEGYACNLRVPLGNESEYAKTILEYPEDYFMPCFIGIGIPKKDAPVIKQKDIDIAKRIHWDKF